MKIIITTSNKYLHIVPIFCYLYNKYWSEPFTLVGYDKPCDLPDNCTFVSLGKQTGDAKNFTRDLRVYFATQDQYFIWMMEDTFIKERVNFLIYAYLKGLSYVIDVGRLNLSHEVTKQDHYLLTYWDGLKIYANSPVSLYRLSTQPSIWNRDYALQYMQKDLTPWEFECQSDYQVDKWNVLGLDKEQSPLVKNEGVRKRNLYEFDLNGMAEEDIKWIENYRRKL